MKKTLFLLIAAITLSIGLNGQSLVKVGEETRTVTRKTQTSSAFTGYYNITDMGLLIGAPSNSYGAPFSLMTINGIHFTDQFSGGLGIGVEFLSGSYMPFVLDFRYYFRDTDFSPFINLYGGYTLPLDDNFSYYGSVIWDAPNVDAYYNYESYNARGGLILNPGFGIRKMFSDEFGLIFTLGYRFQRLYYQGDNDRQLFADYNRLTLKIGITFR